MASPITIELKGIDNATQVVNNVKISLNQLQGTAQTAGDGITGSLRRIGETAAGFLTAQAIPALVDMGRQALGVATTYQGAMNIMQAVSGATAGEMALVGQKAKELGADMTLPATSAGDAAAAMTELVKAGLSVAEAMDSAKGVLQLSAAGQLGNAQAAQIAANALNAYRTAANGAALSSQDMGRVADILAAAANASSASVQDLALGMQMSASNAASAGVPFQSLVTMLGLMSNAGIQGSDAGTSLKTMLMRLQSPTDAAAGLMQQLGIKIYDANGSMNSIQSIIGQFSSKLGGLTQEQRNATLATIFGTDAIRAANIVLMGGVGAFDAMSQAVGRQGAAADLAKAQMAGLGGAFQGLKSQIETSLLNLAEPALPFLEGIVRQFADAVPKVEQSIRALATKAMAALAAFQSGLAAGPGTATANLLVALGLSQETAGQVGALVAQVNSAIQSGLGVLRATMAGFSAGGAGGGASAFAAALGLGPDAAAAIGAAVQQIAGVLQGGLATAVGVARSEFDGLRGVAGVVFAALPGLVMAVLPSLLTIANAVSSTLSVAFQIYGQIASQVFGALPGLAGLAMGVLTSLAGLVGSALAGAFQFLAPIATAALMGIGTIVNMALPPLLQLVAIIAGQLQAAFAALKPMVDSAWAGMQAALPTILPLIQLVADLVGTVLAGAFTALGQIITGDFGGAWQTVQGILTAAGPILSTAAATIVDGIKTAWAFLQPHLVGLAQTAWEAVKAAFSAVVAVLPGIVASIVEGARAAWAFLQPVLVTLAGLAWDGVKAAFQAVVAALPVIVAGIVEGARIAWTFIQPALVTLAGLAWDGVKALFSAAIAALPVIVSAIIEGARVAWGFLQPALVTLAGLAWDGVKALFQAAVAALPVIVAAIIDGVKTAWGFLQPHLVELGNAAWDAVKGLFQQATATLLGVVQGWWGQITGAFNQGTAGIRTSVETGWEGIRSYWVSITGIVSGLSSAWFGALRGTFDLGMGTVRTAAQTGWDAIKTVWGAVQGTVQTITRTFLETVRQLFSGNMDGVKTTVSQGWDSLKTLWSGSFETIKTNTSQTWETIKTAWSTQFDSIKALTNDTWETIKGIWSEASGKLQTLMDKLAEAFHGVSSAISGTISALKKLADKAREIGDSIPQWMRPGSPMPLGIAFEHLAGVLPQAAGAMGDFGKAAAGASASPTVNIQMLVNGQSAGDVGGFAAQLVEVVRALIPPLQGLGTVITEEVKTALGRVNDGLRSIQSILETTIRLVQLVAHPPALTDVSPGSPTILFFQNVTTWASRVTSAAAGAAQSFASVVTDGLKALATAAGQVKTLLETTFSLIALATRPPALTDVMTEGNPTITWFRNVTEWAKRVTTAAAGVAASFADVQTGGLQALNNAAGPLKALLETTFGLIALAVKPPALTDVMSEGSPTLQWFRNVTQWVRNVAAAAAGVANGFETVLTDGLTALNTAAGTTLGLIKTALDTVVAVASPPSIPVITAGSTLATFLTSLIGFARRVSEIALAAATGFTAAAGEGLKALSEAVGQALGVLKNTLDLLVVANTEYTIPVDFAATIRELATLGIQMAQAFLEVANTFTGTVTPAATEAAKAMDMAAKFIKDVYDLGKQIVKEPPAFPANFQSLIQELVSQAKTIATTFIEESNSFATNVGPGAVALLDVYAGMDKFFKGFNKALTAFSEVGSIPTDAKAKVQAVMGVALDIANEYISKANSFTGVGTGATALETTIGGFAKLAKNVKDLLKTLADWGTAGVQSDDIAPALAMFSEVLTSLESLVESSAAASGQGYVTRFAANVRQTVGAARDAVLEVGAALAELAASAGTNAGTAFITQMAAAIKAGKSALASALGEATAGLSAVGQAAGQSAASAGATNGGGGTMTVHNDNRSYNIQVSNANAQAARATNEGLLSLVLYN